MEKKRLYTLLLLFIVPTSLIAQKPKKTYDHEKFAKKAIMSMNYIEKMCADDAALSFISNKTGVSVEELKERQAKNLEMIKEDVKFIMDNSIFGVQESIELTNVQENPVKTADIVVHYSNKDGAFTYVLTNCVQTNISWYMGDGIDPRGEGVKDIIAAREARKEKAENGLWGKLKEVEQKVEAAEEARRKEQAFIDSLNALRSGHVATLFPMNGTDKSSMYYRHDKIDMPLKGYYITNEGKFVDAVIAYQKPEFFVGDFAASANLVICKEANGIKVDVLNPDSEPNFERFIEKGKLRAFYVGDQLFANIDNVGWRIVTSEGAIHTFATIVKVTAGTNSSYQTFEQTQRLNGEVFGSIIGGPSDDKIADLMADAPEIVKEFKDGTISRLEAIVRYNLWYDKEHPGQVPYFKPVAQ